MRDDVPWNMVQCMPPGKKFLKEGAHGEVSVSLDGESVYKAVPRNAWSEMPYEFVMELISRDRCSDIDPEVSRVMPLQAVLESPSHYVMQMRNIKGGDVWDLIAEDKLQGMDVRGIARDVMQAVRVLHSRGVAHRDIKDANVLVEENVSEHGSGADVSQRHRAFLCDMSLATCSPHIVGDPFLPYTGRYRPPEVELYGTKFDFGVDWYKADVYALGAFIARMVCSVIWGSQTGAHPPGRSEVERLMPNFPNKEVVLAMMGDDPNRRPTASEAMAAFGFEVDALPAQVPGRSPVRTSPGRTISRITSFVKEKEFPPWVANVACDIFWTLPSDERNDKYALCNTLKICVAIAAKIGVMTRERDVLGRKFVAEHKRLLKRLSGIVVRNAASRAAIHRLLSSDLPQFV